ncbi:MAG TPA: dienelactone hydrolase family protein, partial [Polyangiaceae bacterium]
VEGAMQFLRAAPRSNGKVGITGFCVGGAISLAAACNVDGLGAVVPFYGIPLAKYADYSRVRAPIQGHYGEKDGSIPLEKPRAVEAAVRAAGGKFELCVYDAGHAFMRESDPAVYQPDAARLAWSRAISFLHEHLG